MGRGADALDTELDLPAAIAHVARIPSYRVTPRTTQAPLVLEIQETIEGEPAYYIQNAVLFALPGRRLFVTYSGRLRGLTGHCGSVVSLDAPACRCGERCLTSVVIDAVWDSADLLAQVQALPQQAVQLLPDSGVLALARDAASSPYFVAVRQGRYLYASKIDAPNLGDEHWPPYGDVENGVCMHCTAPGCGYPELFEIFESQLRTRVADLVRTVVSPDPTTPPLVWSHAFVHLAHPLASVSSIMLPPAPDDSYAPFEGMFSLRIGSLTPLSCFRVSRYPDQICPACRIPNCSHLALLEKYQPLPAAGATSVTPTPAAARRSRRTRP